MVDGLDGLGHNAVVSGHHQNGNISHVGTAGTHAGEGFVAGGIQEGDGGIAHLYLISADGLRDAACLACGNIGFADGIQNRGFAVVNMPHHNHNGVARL